MRFRLKSLVMMPHPRRLAVRTRCESISVLGVTSSSTTSSERVEIFCISVSTSRPRRPRRRRIASAESATSCNSRSTELSTTSGMSTKPVLAMSRMRPSMMTEVSRSTAGRRCAGCCAGPPKNSAASSARRLTPTDAPSAARSKARIDDSQ